MTIGAVPVIRGCGRRQKGGAYAECGLSPWGKPVEEFLIDPPTPLDPRLGVAPQGVKLIERDGVWHVVDWVGANFYPNVADFIEEVRRFGLSRRLPTSTEFAKLTPGSRILLVHSRAIIKNAAEYRPMAKTERTYGCPQWSLHPDHQYGGNVSCAGLWWEDLDGYQVRGDGLPVDPPEWLMRGTGVPSERLVSRPMPSFEYGGFRAPDGVAAEYIPGFFASFPLTRVAIVKDPDEGKHEQTLEAAKDTTLPLELVDE